MNTITTFLLHLIKTAIALLLGLFSFHQLAAQDTGQEQPKTMRLKVIKELNGQTQIIDTTLKAGDHADVLKAIQGLELDTAILRGLNADRPRVLKLDSARLRNVIICIKDLKVDSVRNHALLDGRPRIYNLDREMNAADREAILEKVRKHGLDTTHLHRLKDNRIIFINSDSLTGIHIEKSELLKDANIMKLRSAHPDLLIRPFNDSTGAIRLNMLNLENMERVIVQQHPGTISLDSLMPSGAGIIQLKVITDEKTGEKKVYRIGENGRDVEMKGERLKLDHRNANVIMLLNARVEDITEEDKAALKEAGAPVEKKARHELDVAEISFYPNPNNGRFNLSFTLDDKATTRVSVMDSKGQEVFVDTVEKLKGQYNRQIDLTPFGRGIYYLQIAQGKKYHTKKILVQ
jgi:hypothetical protein